MDNRWRFLYHALPELWGHRQGSGPGYGKTGASKVGVWQANPPYNPKARCGPNRSREAVRHACQEKPLWRNACPYRKPTQVDGERILRPAGEALSRNSAKWPRNFGRRGACEEQAAEKRPKQLFSKNTGLCKTVR